MAAAAPVSHLYLRVADGLRAQIVRGALRPGDRVPSLRHLCRQQDISMSTALQAYLWLESRGYLESRPQSGFYVRTPFSNLIPEPSIRSAKATPPSNGANAILAAVIAAANDPGRIPFGAGCASPELYPIRRLNLILRRILNREPNLAARYEMPPGVETLRRQIARRSPDFGCQLAPDEITITSGALEAVNLGLRAAARPGDVIAVESPTYFGILGSAASLGLQLVEIPAPAPNGMDLGQLETAIRRHRVKAVVTMTNCHNPLGYVLPDSQKRDLVRLTAKHNVAVIENDVYGDIAFAGPRPATAKSFDRKGLVLLCASFSKILAPGYRVGWIAAGRFQAEVERLILLSTVSAPSLEQRVVAEFLESGGYERHLRRLRVTLAAHVDRVRSAISRYFPDGVRISRPAGGYMLWVELPGGVKGLDLFHAALEQRISILPGTIFSSTGRFKNFIRINCGHSWSDAHERALITLGRLCDRL